MIMIKTYYVIARSWPKFEQGAENYLYDNYAEAKNNLIDQHKILETSGIATRFMLLRLDVSEVK